MVTNCTLIQLVPEIRARCSVLYSRRVIKELQKFCPVLLGVPSRRHVGKRSRIMPPSHHHDEEISSIMLPSNLHDEETSPIIPPFHHNVEKRSPFIAGALIGISAIVSLGTGIAALVTSSATENRLSSLENVVRDQDAELRKQAAVANYFSKVVEAIQKFDNMTVTNLAEHEKDFEVFKEDLPATSFLISILVSEIELAGSVISVSFFVFSAARYMFLVECFCCFFVCVTNQVIKKNNKHV